MLSRVPVVRRIKYCPTLTTHKLCTSLLGFLSPTPSSNKTTKTHPRNPPLSLPNLTKNTTKSTSCLTEKTRTPGLTTSAYTVSRLTFTLTLWSQFKALKRLKINSSSPRGSSILSNYTYLSHWINYSVNCLRHTKP